MDTIRDRDDLLRHLERRVSETADRVNELRRTLGSQDRKQQLHLAEGRLYGLQEAMLAVTGWAEHEARTALPFTEEV